LLRPPACRTRSTGRRGLVDEPAESGDPRRGFVRSLRIDLGCAEDGALERERRAAVAADETCARSVKHVYRVAHAPLDLEHPSERKGDRGLSARVRGGIQGRL
jgi:hypothetical protein